MKLDRLFFPMFKELERIGKKITNNLNIKSMTRKEEIKEMARTIASHITSDKDMQVAFADTLRRGAEWADAHPHWISVEDELPPRWETNPNVSVPVITFGTLGESSIPCVELQRYHFGDGRWQYCVATHWMPFQYPKKGGAL